MEDKGLSFEELFNKLGEIVKTLEVGSLTLEQSLSYFEDGMRLAKSCNDRLDAAELKINQLKDSFKEDA